MIDLRSIALAGLLGTTLLAGAGYLVERGRHREAVAAFASYRAKAEEEGRRATQAARDEEARREAEIRKVVTNAQAQNLRAQRDAASARAAGDGLRDALAAARARSCAASPDPAVAPGGPSADATERLLADVQRRLDEAQERVAEHADAARAAGRACERAYNALTP